MSVRSTVRGAESRLVDGRLDSCDAEDLLEVLNFKVTNADAPTTCISDPKPRLGTCDVLD